MTPPSCLKVRGWWWWVVGGGLQHFSVSLRPLGFGFLGFWVSGLRVWGQGLTICMSGVMWSNGGSDVVSLTPLSPVHCPHSLSAPRRQNWKPINISLDQSLLTYPACHKAVRRYASFVAM